jgi:hypothetical protein
MHPSQHKIVDGLYWLLDVFVVRLETKQPIMMCCCCLWPTLQLLEYYLDYVFRKLMRECEYPGRHRFSVLVLVRLILQYSYLHTYIYRWVERCASPSLCTRYGGKPKSLPINCRPPSSQVRPHAKNEIKSHFLQLALGLQSFSISHRKPTRLRLLR